MTALPRIATAIDIGTNTLLALTARCGDAGCLERMVDRATITGLGRGVDASRRLADEGKARALVALRAFANEARSLGSERIDAVATSAVRDADDRDEFLRAARAITGGSVEVVSGDREAALTFQGAVDGTAIAAGCEILAFDVGGGSTELIVGPAEGPTRWRTSIDIGSVRLTERLGLGGIVGAEQLRSLRETIERALPPNLPQHETVVGLAATVMTIACVSKQIPWSEAHRVHGAELSREQIYAVLGRLASCTNDERAATVGLDPRRADLIVAGSAIVAAVLARSGRDRLVASDGGVRVGLLREMLGIPAAALT